MAATSTRVQVTTATEDTDTLEDTTATTATSAEPGTITTEQATTTADPATTTADPGTATADPATKTADPAATTADPATKTADPAATTADPATKTADPATTTTPADPCNPNPCGPGSTCASRADQTFVCLCLPGDAYNNQAKTCEIAKVFPGQVQLSKEPYDESMKDPKSQKFKETADEIVAELDTVFKENPTYTGSTVLALLPSDNVLIRSDQVVTASVEIKFSASSQIKSDQVLKQIEDYKCTDCVLDGATFKETDLCTLDPCDRQSTQCKSGDGSFSCTCMEGYIRTNYSIRICVPVCPYGQELKGGTCKNCAFGYSGFNCSENWKLILVIVGCVLGGLLLIAFILLPVVATLNSKKSSKKNKDADMEKPNQASFNIPLATSRFGNNQAGPFSGSANGQAGFSNNGMSKFPRVATNSWDNRTKQEMNPTNNRHSFGPTDRSSRIYDDPYDVSPYARPQNAINPPKTNPYAQSQGHSNPYYTHDDGKRFY
ncbi:mucin-13b isoform X2 [Archocentrus centrarchus]|uniref:mucin-13b isoform X2 n=1 Tax=Archocentrus centrarchus TaxID=63155 RepID=UPI0011E9D89F|nr:mucin-13-like isoform X2 [Archocentrus centrarchus]